MFIFDLIPWLLVIGIFALFIWIINTFGAVKGFIILLVGAGVLKVILFIWDLFDPSSSNDKDEDEFSDETETEKKKWRHGYREPGLLDIIAEEGKEERCYNCKHNMGGHCIYQDESVDMLNTCYRYKRE
ncbi:MAG: hypothetical protein IJ325_12580 [Clostridia bacterium]|nr:hypothetical protein [Clostridia bacterium]